MNKVILIGRLTRDPEVRYTQSAEPLAVAKFTLAVDRRFKREGEPDADFIYCKSFGKQAEFAERYLKKGMKIALVGRISVYSFDDQAGQKRWVTEVITEDVEFAESRSAYEARMAQSAGDAGFAGGPPDRYGSANRGASDYNAPSRNTSYATNATNASSAPNAPSPFNGPSAPNGSPIGQANYEPEGFSAITESIDDDDLPF